MKPRTVKPRTELAVGLVVVTLTVIGRCVREVGAAIVDGMVYADELIRGSGG